MICPQITQMNADFQNANKDPQTYAIIGAAMEVHCQLFNLRESAKSADSNPADKIKNINLIGV
jgi:hypothetical protein